MLKLCHLAACPSGTLGMHLSRAPWDPYPWVSAVQAGSSAHRAGLQDGDAVLQLNGRDVLGHTIAQIAQGIAEHWKSGAAHITVAIWRYQADDSSATNSCGDERGDDAERSGNDPRNKQHQHNVNQTSLQKFATCLQHIAQLLQCPVCLEVIRPPARQCCNGHVLCNNCRSRSLKCPVCRVDLGARGRCLIADQLFTLLAEAFPCDGASNGHSDEEEADKQLEAYKTQQRRGSHVKQATEVIPEESRRAGGGGAEGVAEQELLLRGQREVELPRQQLLSQLSAHVNRDVANDVDEEGLQQQKHLQRLSGTMRQQQQPEDRTINTTAPSLNTTTTISKAVALGAADGGVAADGRVSRASNECKEPKLWRRLIQLWPIISQPLAVFIVFLMLWTVGYILLPAHAAPGSGIMRMAFLFVGAQISGILAAFLRLPDMLGMLFFGVLYTNAGLADFTGLQRLEALLREMALISIMLLAGFGLDWRAFKQLWLMILRLALVPTTAEVAAVAVLAHFLLNMPWLWGILLGLVVTAVSPNVVVTVMLKLKEDRLGLNDGIHTLIYAATTCNDVVAIFLFGVVMGVIFSTGSLADQILQGPIGIGVGVVFGYVYGSMLLFIPSKKARYVDGLRFVLTVLGGAISVMGSKAIGYPSAGALGCVTVAFIAGIGWKRELQQQQKQQQQQLDEAEQQPQQQQPTIDDNISVAQRLDLLWKFLKPVSFALIGKEINFSVLDGGLVGYGMLLVLLGSLFRLLFAYISTFGGSLSRKERAYITISGFPKATVQAALGPIALDLARSLQADADGAAESVSLSNNVLIISVLSIVCTAPIGAILMLRLAPLWLQYSPPTRSAVDEGTRRSSGNVLDSFDSEASTKSQPFSGDALAAAAVEAGVANRRDLHGNWM